MSNKQFSSYNPRKAEWEGTLIDQWEPSLWKQWKAKESDKNNFIKLEREYLRIKYSVSQANLALSLDTVKVKLKLTNAKTIALQGTFPCKPGDIGKNNSSNKQYTISLGFPANDAGLKTAVAKARELDLLLMTKQFQWTPELLGKQAQKLSPIFVEKPFKKIRELIEDYHDEFWKTHEKNRQGIKTWESHYLRHLKKLPQDECLSEAALESALNSTKPNTNSRFYLAWQLKKFCKFCDFDGIKIIDSYATRLPQPTLRQIPTDEEIVNGFSTIGKPLSSHASKDVTLPEQWQWLYGMLATYGLRPHELFAVNLEAFTDTNNQFHLVYLNPSLTGGTKTGERSCGIPPIYPHWVELFDLKNIRFPQSGGTLSNKTALIHIKFRTISIGFKPYDLRHAFAIRGHRLRIPIKTMADYMGHTVQEHTKTYQRWMDEDTNLQIYQEVVIHRSGTTKEALKERIKDLEAENLALKAENDSFKGILIQHRLGKLIASGEIIKNSREVE
ncbi:MAG: integrase [Richelia sp. SL_2_1]|nr:integrase [Richelia sp. SM1_7_0]NJO30979.1 integrase [Richelia sp. SL_2_1]